MSKKPIKNRILQRRAADYGFIYADSEEIAQEMGNAQLHTHAFMLVGTAAYDLDFSKVAKELMADLECCKTKLNHDAPGIELNQPIVFPTKYRAMNHVQNGSMVFGVLLTGNKSLIIS